MFFDLDVWHEMAGAVRRNRLRTFLTALAVAWGIFMLVVLLAAGNGLRNGMEHQMRGDAANSIAIQAGKTSMAFGGHPVGRQIQLTSADYEAIKRLPGVEHITARVYLWNEGTVKRDERIGSFDIRAVHADHRFLESTEMIGGRYIDELDLAERRKTAIIGDEVRDFLFAPEEEPIGQWIGIHGIPYQVVGVFQDDGGEGERRRIFIPVTTAQMAYAGARGGSERVDQILFTVGHADVEASKRLEEKVIGLMAGRHHFAPEDRRALRIWNNLEAHQRMSMIFVVLELFVWVVGFLTVLAGVVGVSNVMLIAVTERTREIGIRKALGATPASILSMITQEALALTAVSGYVGLVAGVGVTELVATFSPPVDFFRDPQVDMRVALSATALLVLCGVLAGLVPAWRAGRITVIEALRDR